jgi:hypothetical protein
MHQMQWQFKMRTTLDIDEEVLRAAKEIARRRSTAGAVISELARQAPAGRANVPPGISEPEAFYGFRPLPADGRIVSTETVENLREDEGI